MKARFLEWIHSIQGRLLTYFTVLFLLVIGSMIVFYQISIHIIYDTATESVKNTIRQLTQIQIAFCQMRLARRNKLQGMWKVHAGMPVWRITDFSRFVLN